MEKGQGLTTKRLLLILITVGLATVGMTQDDVTGTLLTKATQEGHG